MARILTAPAAHPICDIAKRRSATFYGVCSRCPQKGASFTGSSWFAEDESETPTDFVVMGDFNLKPDSTEYLEIVGKPDYYYGPSLAGDRLVDTWTRADNPITEGISWYDEAGVLDRGIKLDYGFVSPGLAPRVTSAWIDNDAIGSDHQPTWFESAD